MTVTTRMGLGLALLTVLGCGGTADVSGKVTYQGKPVVFGTVLIIGADGIPKSGPIQPDGSFQARGIKVGPAKVTVSSPTPPGVGASAKKGRGGRDDPDERTPADAGSSVSPEVAKAWVPLPQKYADPEKSGLTADIGSGQPINLDLK